MKRSLAGISKLALGVIAMGAMFSVGMYADAQIGQSTWTYTLTSVPNHPSEKVWLVDNTAYSLSATDPETVELNVKTSSGSTQSVYVSPTVADYYKAFPTKLSNSEYANTDYGFIFVQNDVPDPKGVAPGQSVVYNTNSGTYTYGKSAASDASVSTSSTNTAPATTNPSGTSTGTATSGSNAQPSQADIQAAEVSLGSGYKYVPYDQAPTYVQETVMDPAHELIFQILNPQYPPSMIKEYHANGWALPAQYMISFTSLN